MAYSAGLGDAWVPPAHGTFSSDRSARWMVNPNAEGNTTGGWMPVNMWNDILRMLARIKLGVQAFSAQDRPDILDPVARAIEAESLVLGHLPRIERDIQLVQAPGTFNVTVTAGTLEKAPPPPPPNPVAPMPTTAPPLVSAVVGPTPAQLTDYIVKVFAAHNIALAPTAQGVKDWVNNLTARTSTYDSFESAVADWAPKQAGGLAKPKVKVPRPPAFTPVTVRPVATVVPVANAVVAKPAPVAVLTAAPPAPTSGKRNWGLWVAAGLGLAAWFGTRRRRR